MGVTGAILTSSVFLAFVTFELVNTTSASSLTQQNTIQSSQRVKRYGDRDPFADFDARVRSNEKEFDRHREQMSRDWEESKREHDRWWKSQNNDFNARSSLISNIVIPLGLLGFVVPCIILICCCVPCCPLSRRREQGGMVHRGQSNGNRFGFGGLPPGSLGGANVTTTTYPSQHQTTAYPPQHQTTTYPPQHQTTTYPPQHQTTTYPPQHRGNTGIPLLPPQPSPVPHQAYLDTKGPELPPAYHDVMQSTTSSYPSSNMDPSAPKILPYNTQPAFNPHAM